MLFPVALFLALPMHTLFHHTVMDAVAPFYQAFDTATKHAWSGRATSFVTQAAILPAFLNGNMTVFHHSLGAYIAADMLHMLMYAKRDIMMWAHHIGSLTAYVLSFQLPPELNATLLQGAFLMECTNPFVHGCWFANKAGYSTSWWFPYFAGLTISVYFAFRCIAFPWFVLTRMPLALWVFGIPFTMMNYAWFVQLVTYAKAVLTKAGASRLV